MTSDDKLPNPSPNLLSIKASEGLKGETDHKYNNLSINLMLNVKAQNPEGVPVPKTNNLLPPLTISRRIQPLHPYNNQEPKNITYKQDQTFQTIQTIQASQTSSPSTFYPKLQAEPVNVLQTTPYAPAVHVGYQQHPPFHPFQSFIGQSGLGSHSGPREYIPVSAPVSTLGQAPYLQLGQQDINSVQIPYQHIGQPLEHQTHLALELDPLKEYKSGRRFRRRYNQIVRKYSCASPGCTKSYGSLNHLNTHIVTKKHGYRKSKADFQPHNYLEENSTPSQYYGETHSLPIYQPPISYPSDYNSGNYWYHPQQNGQPPPPPPQNGQSYPQPALPVGVRIPNSNGAPGYIYYPPGYSQPPSIGPGVMTSPMPGQLHQQQRPSLPPKQTYSVYSPMQQGLQQNYLQPQGIFYGSHTPPPPISTHPIQPPPKAKSAAEPLLQNSSNESLREDSNTSTNGSSSR